MPAIISIRLQPSDLVRITPESHRTGQNPSNLETDAGKYFRADVVTKQIRVQYAEGAIPPFVASSLLAAGGQGDQEPRLAEDFRGRLTCLFTRDFGSGDLRVFQAISDTDALDFSVPQQLAAAASRPVAVSHPASGVLVRAWRNSDGSAQALVNHPGEDPAAFSPITLSGITLDDDCFAVVPGLEGSARWWLIGVFGGQISLYWSAAETPPLSTWNHFADLLAGGSHPVLAVSPEDGRLVAGAWFPDKSLQFCTMGPADGAFGAAVVVTAAGGGGLSWAEGCFGLAAAYEEAARWVLVAVVDGEASPSEWWAGDENGWTFTRVS